MDWVAKQALTISPLPKEWRGTFTYQAWGIYIIIFIEDDHISPIRVHALNSTVCVRLKGVCGQSRERSYAIADGRPQDMCSEDLKILAFEKDALCLG